MSRVALALAAMDAAMVEAYPGARWFTVKLTQDERAKAVAKAHRLAIVDRHRRIERRGRRRGVSA